MPFYWIWVQLRYSEIMNKEAVFYDLKMELYEWQQEGGLQ